MGRGRVGEAVKVEACSLDMNHACDDLIDRLSAEITRRIGNVSPRNQLGTIRSFSR